jgi:hypothetical protein
MSEFSLAQQIEEVERELRLRRGVYEHQIATGKMRKSVADYHMGRMQAVRETLKKLLATEQKQ